MKIALVSCVYPPYKSGIGNVAARHARQLTDMGHRVTVYCPVHDDEPGRDIVDGIVVERLRSLVRHGNSALVPQLVRHMKGHDAVYIMWPFFGGAESAAIGARMHKIPYIVFFHMDVLWDGWRGKRFWTATSAPPSHGSCAMPMPCWPAQQSSRRPHRLGM